MDSGEGRGMPQLDINCNDWGCSLFYFFQCLLLQRKGHRNNGVAVSKLRGWKLRMRWGGSGEMISLWCKFDTKSGRK